jgi:hypothetical protein
VATSTADSSLRWQQSIEDLEVAFEEEAAMERRRRKELRKRAVNRSRARRIEQVEKRGTIRFSVLFAALTATAVTVVIVMFETLAWLVGG